MFRCFCKTPRRINNSTRLILVVVVCREQDMEIAQNTVYTILSDKSLMGLFNAVLR